MNTPAAPSAGVILCPLKEQSRDDGTARSVSLRNMFGYLSLFGLILCQKALAAIAAIRSTLLIFAWYERVSLYVMSLNAL